MKFRCPYCRKESDFLEVTADENLTAIIQMMPAFGRDAHLVWAYAELFGGIPLRAKARKLRVILEEVRRLYDGESFSYNRAVYRISRAGIAEALSICVKRHFSDPIDNHNYLKKIMIGIAEREAREAGQQAERGLRSKEERLCAGEDRGSYPIPEGGIEPPAMKTIPPAHLTEEEIAANRRRLKEMIGKLE